MKKIFSILALALAAMTASATAFDLTVGKSEKGTVTFLVGGTEVKSAQEGMAVTMEITPEGGYTVTAVANSLYTDWNGARSQAIDIATSVEMRKVADNVYVFTMPRASVEVDVEYGIEIPTPAEDQKDKEKEVPNVALDMQPAEGEQPQHDPVTGITVIPVDITGIDVPETAPREIVVEVAARTQVGNNIFEVREIKADAFKTSTANVKVTKVILPETEEPLKIEEGAMKPDGTPIDVEVPLAMLDDYALLKALKENFEEKRISAKEKAPARFWTFSCGVDTKVPEGITVYRAFTEKGTIQVLPIDEVNESGIIKANNGVLLSCDNLKGGSIYEFIANPGAQMSGTVPATTDAKSYSNNALVPTIVATNYPTGRYYILKSNQFHTMSANGKVKPCKAVFDTRK